MYCFNCGQPVDEKANQCPYCNAQVSKLMPVSSNTRPLRVPEYFLYTVLFILPVIGLIATIICSLKSNHSLRNYARACIILRVILYIAALLLWIFGEDLIKALWDTLKSFNS